MPPMDVCTRVRSVLIAFVLRASFLFIFKQVELQRMTVAVDVSGDRGISKTIICFGEGSKPLKGCSLQGVVLNDVLPEHTHSACCNSSAPFVRHFLIFPSLPSLFMWGLLWSAQCACLAS